MKMFKGKKKEKEAPEEKAEKAETRSAPTEPWKAESHADHPRKKGLLGLASVKDGYNVRWVRQDKVDQRKMQGYVVAEPAAYGCQADENGMIRRNELVLMEVPTEVYDERRQAVVKQSELMRKAAKSEFLKDRAKASRESGHNLSDDERDDE